MSIEPWIEMSQADQLEALAMLDRHPGPATAYLRTLIGWAIHKRPVMLMRWGAEGIAIIQDGLLSVHIIEDTDGPPPHLIVVVKLREITAYYSPESHVPRGVAVALDSDANLFEPAYSDEWYRA